MPIQYPDRLFHAVFVRTLADGKKAIIAKKMLATGAGYLAYVEDRATGTVYSVDQVALAQPLNDASRVRVGRWFDSLEHALTACGWTSHNPTERPETEQ